MFPLDNTWLCTLEYDTFDLIPSSEIGRKAKDKQLIKTGDFAGYKINTLYSAGAACWAQSKLVDYLNWYTHKNYMGYGSKKYLDKVYFLDIENKILVIGEQNLKTGEWEGDFEAYFLNINDWIYERDKEIYKNKPMLFLKGKHEKNKKVGEWTHYSLYNFDNLSQKIDYIDASGKFLRSETKPFAGFSAAEFLQFEQVVKPILEKEKK